jgi:hypothetical protein
LFFWLVLVTIVRVSCGAPAGFYPVVAKVEFGARIVVQAGGKRLGPMAKAGLPIGMDRALIPPAKVTKGKPAADNERT